MIMVLSFNRFNITVVCHTSSIPQQDLHISIYSIYVYARMVGGSVGLYKKGSLGSRLRPRARAAGRPCFGAALGVPAALELELMSTEKHESWSKFLFPKQGNFT